MSTRDVGSNSQAEGADRSRDDMKSETVQAVTSFASAADLARALKRAEAAHAEHEARTGEADPDWPQWYAEYMVREQSGAELPL